MTDNVDKAIAWDAIAEKNAEIVRLRQALGDIRIFANGPGDRRAVVDKIYGIATQALRGPVGGASQP
jgi:hypothetical protein